MRVFFFLIELHVCFFFVAGEFEGVFEIIFVKDSKLLESILFDAVFCKWFDACSMVVDLFFFFFVRRIVFLKNDSGSFSVRL
jgi:hypothetical protein